jgi:hypothetical protein
MGARFCRLGVVLMLVVLGVVVATPAPASAVGSGSFLQMTSQAGDYIGQGQTWAYGPNDGQFSSLIQYGYVSDIEIKTSNPGEWWSLWFASPDHGRLVPGTYTGATSSFSLGQPGLDVSGTGRGCTAGGEFTVLDVAYDAAGKTAFLDATFSQTCQGSSAALTGEVRYVAPPMVDPAPSVNVRLTDSARTAGTLSIGLGAFSDPAGDAAGPWQVHVDWGDASSDDFAAATQGVLGARTHTYPVSAAVYNASVLVTNARGASAQTRFTVTESDAPRVGSFMSLTGQPGAGVLGNRSVSLADGATYSASIVYNSIVAINAVSGDSTESWSLWFGAPDRQRLVPGVYTNAVRAAFAGPGQPGLDISGNSSGCNQVSGSFDVLQALYGPDGTPVLFDATFSESCETSSPAFTGEIHYVAPTWVPPVIAVGDQTYTEADVNAGVYTVQLGTLGDTSPGAAGPYNLVVDWGDGTFNTEAVSLGPILPLGHHYASLGSYVVTVAATSPAGYRTAASFNLNLVNVAPAVSAVRYDGTSGPVQVGTTVALAADFVAPGFDETYVATFYWGDGSNSAGMVSAGSQPSAWTARARHAYTKAALYTVTVTVSNGSGSGSGTLQNVVVYNTASTLSGKGSIVSPAGACRLSAACSKSSTASFNVDARYFKGAPRVSFSFSATGFSLSTSQADWLVTSNETAVMQGRCTVNGLSGYTYRLTALAGATGSLRLQVWDASRVLVYDNNALTALKSGSISVM